MKDHDPAPAAQKARPEALSRRAFLWRLAGAGVAAAAVGGIGLSLRDAVGPAAMENARALATLGDFAVPAPIAGKPRLAEVHGTDRAAMFTAGVAALGGMAAFVARGDTVLLKVNAAFAAPAVLGATTSPELLAAVATACREAGASRVLVADNPINNPESCFEVAGLADAARATGARLVLPRPALFSPLSLPHGRLLKDWPVFSGAFAGVTKVITLAPVKDHQRAVASMSLKNLYGLLGGRRNIFHQDINGIIAELGAMLTPTLCVLDGTTVMMTNGPTGGSLSDLRQAGVMYLSADPVATDALGVGLLGKTPADLPYLALAQAAGVGTTDVASLNPVTVNTEPAAG
ncbi:DUF362 domain-containing protein [Solidesulfovibrio sp.]|uniref:DUF362 domain-containing protein n=1 Tax=Solidesulfovibrio sp. TaxID=2910990 RepID=UPI0026204C6F|nr:DUF362 domain-containing protein [Solidesulfovibrio sp.]